MTKENVTVEMLDELIADLQKQLENGATAEDVRSFVECHPDYRKQLLGFAAQWLASDGSDLSDDSQDVSHTVAGHAELLEAFWDRFSIPDADPFSGLDSIALADIANRCRIDTTILRKLHHRLIDETTLPARLVLWIGDATDTMPGSIWSYLAHEPLAMHADFFAPDGKKIGGKMSFPAAVEESRLGDADKQFWLASTGS
jgi:hypothetical protein